MKIDFLLLSLSLFVSLSYADESAQNLVVTTAETPQPEESEPSEVADDEVVAEAESSQNSSEAATITDAGHPAEAEATLVEEEPTPVEEEATPVEEEATPVEEEATPAEEEATPTEEEPTPVVEESTPTEAEATPAEEESTPAEEEATPTEEEPTPVVEETSQAAETLSADAANESTEAEPEEITPRHPGDAYLELALGLYESCRSLGLVLEQVHNMPSADAAAPEVATLTNRILELMRSESMLPPPSLEIQQYVQEHTSELNTAEVSEKAIGRVIDLITNTDPICYGSVALRSELQRLVRGLLGQ